MRIKNYHFEKVHVLALDHFPSVCISEMVLNITECKYFSFFFVNLNTIYLSVDVELINIKTSSLQGPPALKYVSKKCKR